ncbi:MAG: DinB family protein [Acidobacteriota bacterium]
MSREVLLEQFTACYDENNWFVSLKSVLDGVTAEQAAWKPANVENSIWESVNHIIFWNERWLQRFRGELNEPQDVENESTFRSSETDWQATIAKMNSVMKEWRDKLGLIDDQKLDSPVNEQYQAPWRSPLAQQNIHNAYHIGQILLLRKLQGSWEADKGVS